MKEEGRKMKEGKRMKDERMKEAGLEEKKSLRKIK